MSVRTTTVVTDDITGEPGASPVSLMLDDVHYEIDLSPANRLKLQRVLDKYITKARPVRGDKRIRRTRSTTRPKGRNPKPAAKPETRAVREWAVANGYDVGSRGRIPDNVHEAYAAAH